MARISGAGVIRHRATPLVRAGIQLSEADAASLAKQILEKEEHLASLFQSGKPMPRASVVSGLRAEIAQMRAKLKGNGSEEVVREVDTATAERARRALAEVERTLSQTYSNYGVSTDIELARVEEENIRLRAEAHNLLLYQKRLADKLRQVAEY